MSLRIRIMFSFPHYQVLIISILLSLLGISEIVLAVVAFIREIWGHYTGAGMWTGLASFIAGIMGITAVNTKGLCIIRLFFSASVVSIFISFTLMVLSSGGLDIESGFYSHPPRSISTSTQIVHGFLLGVGLLQFILSILTSYICFKHLFWNERSIKNRHKRALDNITSAEGGIQRFGRASTNSNAPLVSGHKRHRKKHRRRSDSNRSLGSDDASGNYVEAFADRIKPKSHRKKSKRFSPGIKSIHGRRHRSRGQEVVVSVGNEESLATLVTPGTRIRDESLDIRQPPERNNHRRNNLRETAVHHHIPIDEDEELPPYREIEPSASRSVRHDEESIIPNSESDIETSDSDSDSLTSEGLSSDDDIAIETWDSISQSNIPVGQNYTAARSCVSDQLASDRGHVTAIVHTISSSHPELQQDIDPQGVNYHEFTRTKNVIKSATLPKRSDSFQNERNFARDAKPPTSRFGSIPEVSKILITNSGTAANESQTAVPPKPPRSSLSEEIPPTVKSGGTTDNNTNPQELSLITKQFKALCSSLEQATQKSSNASQKPLHQTDQSNSAKPIIIPMLDSQPIVKPKSTCMVLPMTDLYKSKNGTNVAKSAAVEPFQSNVGDSDMVNQNTVPSRSQFLTPTTISPIGESLARGHTTDKKQHKHLVGISRSQHSPPSLTKTNREEGDTRNKLRIPDTSQMFVTLPKRVASRPPDSDQTYSSMYVPPVSENKIATQVSHSRTVSRHLFTPSINCEHEQITGACAPQHPELPMSSASGNGSLQLLSNELDANNQISGADLEHLQQRDDGEQANDDDEEMAGDACTHSSKPIYSLLL